MGKASTARGGEILLGSFKRLIGTRDHGTGLQAYLKDVIERLPVTRPSELDALLSANWTAANRAAHAAIMSEGPQTA